MRRTSGIWRGLVLLGGGAHYDVVQRLRLTVVIVALLATALTGCSPVTPVLTAAVTHRSTPQCTDGALRVSVQRDPTSPRAGQQRAFVVFRNEGRTTRYLHGDPGVSLVGHGNGTQLGAPARRDPALSDVQVKIPAGAYAVSLLQYQVFTRGCASMRADGFRVYPPHSYRAFSAPFPLRECTLQMTVDSVTAAQEFKYFSAENRCAPQDLRVSDGPRVSPVTEEQGDIYKISDAGAGECTLAGYPHATLQLPDGKTAPLPDSHALNQYMTNKPPATVVLARNKPAFFLVAKNACEVGPSTATTGITITLPGATAAFQLPLSRGREAALPICTAAAPPPAKVLYVSPVEPDLSSLVP